MAKKDRVPEGVIERALCQLVNGDGDFELAEKAGAFAHCLRVVRPDSGGAPIILHIEDNTAKIITGEYAAGLLRHYVEALQGSLIPYNIIFSKCRAVIHAWSHGYVHFRALPKPLGFKSDPDLCFKRLSFDPEFLTSKDLLRIKAPLFDEMLGRTENADALCLRLGSLFDLSADRKQVVWMSGPADCGKSVFSWLITLLVGDAYGLLSNADLQTPYWKAQLVGKRIGIVNEAATRFIRSDEFKAITGDDEHSVNQKNKPIINVSLPVMLFFFSNNPPEIPHDDALMARIIDCRIKSLEKEAIVPNAIIRQKLTEELPAIAGYCITQYRSLEDGGRIPCINGDLESTIDSFEATYIDFIEHHYVMEEGTAILRRDFYTAMMNAGIRKGDDQWRCKRVLMNRYKCIESRQKVANTQDFSMGRVFVIKGLRPRGDMEKEYPEGCKLVILGRTTGVGQGSSRVLSVVKDDD